jgi:hypothetical protein
MAAYIPVEPSTHYTLDGPQSRSGERRIAPRPVVAPGRLIIWRPFKPIFFKYCSTPYFQHIPVMSQRLLRVGALGSCPAGSPLNPVLGERIISRAPTDRISAGKTASPNILLLQLFFFLSHTVKSTHILQNLVTPWQPQRVTGCRRSQLNENWDLTEQHNSNQLCARHVLQKRWKQLEMRRRGHTACIGNQKCVQNLCCRIWMAFWL